jgi:multicomponent Na+:H+ antiporter subunit D
MNSPLLALPLLIPLVTVGVMLCAWRMAEAARHALNITACAAMLAVAAALCHATADGTVLALHVAAWPAPLGITLVADTLTALMVAVTAVIGLAVAVYAAGAGTGKFRGYFAPLFLALLTGVNGSFVTGDLFNLYVWFEVMLMASFVLVALPGGRGQMEGAVKYLTLNFVASALFLVGLGVLYGKFGTLNMADLALKIGAMENSETTRVTSVLFLAAFGIKAGIVPFHFWLPASYHVTPTPVAAVFAGLLTKVGVYACARVFTLVYAGQQEFLSAILLPLAVLTMLVGVFGAASQFFIPRILSFHIISQIGYMVAGIGMFSRGALAATVFYIIHHILVKANLFLIGGLIGRHTGSQHLDRCGGLYQRAPWLALLFLVPALSLGGIPPLSGFFAKFALIREGLLRDHPWVVAAALAVGLLTLYSMIKIWNEAFWKRSPAAPAAGGFRVPAAMWAPCVALALGTLALGLCPVWLLSAAERAAGQLTDPRSYIEAVLGTAHPPLAEP